MTRRALTPRHGLSKGPGLVVCPFTRRSGVTQGHPRPSGDSGRAGARGTGWVSKVTAIASGQTFRRRAQGRSAEVDLEEPLASATWVTPGRITTRDYPDHPRHGTPGPISPARHTSPAEHPRSTSAERPAPRE